MTKRTAAVLLSSSLLAAAAAGCSSVPYAEPPPSPAVSTVHGGFRQIDGCSVGLGIVPSTYRILPGRHEFAMSAGNAQIRLAMLARPAQSYDIDSNFIGIVTLRNNTTHNEIYYDPSTAVYFDKSKTPLPGGFDQPPSP
jgi:hypothetical protein